MYRSDGTAEVRSRLAPLRTAPVEYRRFWTEYPSSVVADDRLFFAADDGIRGVELWSTDGTPEGTRLVDDLRPDSRAPLRSGSWPRTATSTSPLTTARTVGSSGSSR